VSAPERLGRENHPTLGKCVRVKLRTWQGPVEAGRTGREVWTECLVPVEQHKYLQHKRHITAFDPAGDNRLFCISPSCSFYAELVKYANVRWSPKA
jgi:hypothetical protein